MKNITLLQVASIIGEESVQKLINAFPGDRIYLKRDLVDIQARNKQILNEWYHSQISKEELSKKYYLSISTINNIIREGIKRQ